MPAMNASVNVEVTRNQSETTASLVRRFTKRVQGAGILPRVRGKRYNKRTLSKAVRRKGALKTLASRERYTELVKLGKIQEKTPRSH